MYFCCSNASLLSLYIESFRYALICSSWLLLALARRSQLLPRVRTQLHACHCWLAGCPEQTQQSSDWVTGCYFAKGKGRALLAGGLWTIMAWSRKCSTHDWDSASAYVAVTEVQRLYSLQAANAYMARDLADLLSAQGNSSGPLFLMCFISKPLVVLTLLFTEFSYNSKYLFKSAHITQHIYGINSLSCAVQSIIISAHRRCSTP